jgi:hypothetical protein
MRKRRPRRDSGSLRIASMGIAGLAIFGWAGRGDFSSGVPRGALLLIVSLPPRPTCEPQNGQPHRSSCHPGARRTCRQFSVGVGFRRRRRTRAQSAFRCRHPSREVSKGLGGADWTDLRVVNFLAVKADAGDPELHTGLILSRGRSPSEWPRIVPSAFMIPPHHSLGLNTTTKCLHAHHIAFYRTSASILRTVSAPLNDDEICNACSSDSRASAFRPARRYAAPRCWW